MLASLYLFFLHALVCSSFEVKEEKGKQLCDLVWDSWKEPNTARAPKWGRLCTFESTVHHGSTMGCRCFCAHGKFLFHFQAKWSSLAGSCVSPAEPLTATESHQQGSGCINSKLACAVWSMSSSDFFSCPISCVILLCVLWKQVINKAQTAPLSKRF